VAVTVNENTPDRESVAVTVATCTSWCFAGVSRQRVGRPAMTGPVLSIATFSD